MKSLLLLHLHLVVLPDRPSILVSSAMVCFMSVGILATIILQALAQSPTLRYMPFGDSITDYGCWRAWIWEKFQNDGYDVDFVGTRKAEATCNGLNYDRDHEGHPGYLASNIANQNQLVGWLNQNPADIITMHLGTNDIFQAQHKTPETIAAFSKLVDQMRASNPVMRIIVSSSTFRTCFAY